MPLPPPSEEQRRVLQELAALCNVIVNAVAGSGKTTLMLHACIELIRRTPRAHVLIVTYNSSLKLDTRKRVRELGLSKQVHVHSYHSAACAYYRSGIKNDTLLEDLICDIKAGSVHAKASTPPFALVCCDEVQDMTPSFFVLLSALVQQSRSTATPNVQYLVAGDTYQTLYAYKGADARFLSQSDALMTCTELPWVRCPLSTSFRLTERCARFVNTVLGEDRVRGGNSVDNDVPVEYRVLNAYSARFVQLVEGMSAEYGVGNVAVIGASVKSGTPLAQYVNSHVKDQMYGTGTKRKIDFFLSNDRGGTARTREGKQHVGTIHSVKGREYMCVVAVLDGFRNTREDVARCNNLVYVAITRQRSRLIVVQHVETDPYARFHATQDAWDPEFVTFTGNMPDELEFKDVAIPNVVGVTDMLKHMPPPAMKRLTQTFVSDATVEPEGVPLSYTTEVEFDTCVEEVSALYGIAIPLLYEIETTRSSVSLERSVSAQLCNTKEEKMAYLFANNGQGAFTRREYALLFPEPLRPVTMMNYNTLRGSPSVSSSAALMMVANALHAFAGAHHLLRQIRSYDWAEENVLEEALRRLHGKFDSRHGKEFEKVYGVVVGEELKVSGSVDVVSVNDEVTTLWELKFKNGTDRQDVLQLAVYVALCQSHPDTHTTVEGRLFNVRTGEERLIHVHRPEEFLSEVAEMYLTQQRQRSNHSSDTGDAEFVAVHTSLRGTLPEPGPLRTEPSGPAMITAFFRPVAAAAIPDECGFFLTTDSLDFEEDCIALDE